MAGFFQSKSYPTIKAKNVGDVVDGVLDRPYTESEIHKVKRLRDGSYQQGEVDTYDDGSPKMQAVLILRTDLRDPARQDDEGLRTFYVNSAALKKAIAVAIKGSGEPDMFPGGRLKVQRLAEYDRDAGGVQDLFTADWTPAASSGDNGFFGGNEASAPAAPSAPVASAQPNVAEQVKTYVDAGLTAPQIADIVGQPVEVVQAIIKAAAPF